MSYYFKVLFFHILLFSPVAYAYQAQQINESTKAFTFAVNAEACIEQEFSTVDPIGRPDISCFYTDSAANRKLLSDGGRPFSAWLSEGQKQSIQVGDLTVEVHGYPAGYKISVIPVVKAKLAVRAIRDAAKMSAFPSEISTFFYDASEQASFSAPPESQMIPKSEPNTETHPLLKPKPRPDDFNSSVPGI